MVTTAVVVRRKLRATEGIGYIGAQLVAACSAGLLARAIVGPDPLASVASIWKVFGVEFIFTFGLAYVVLNVATASATEGNSFFGLAIGFTVTVGAFAVGGVSGGAFNPAVAMGASLVGAFRWATYWIYACAAVLARAAAARAFLYTQPAERHA